MRLTVSSPTALTWARLHTFLAVLEDGSITGAADLLQVSAPAVSASISALEADLGTALFVKSGRGIRATDAAATFAGYARQLLGLAEEAKAAVLDADRSRLRIGAVETAAESVLPRMLASFTEHHPRVEVALTVGPRDGLFGQLGQHEIDVVLAGRPPRGSDFVSRAVWANVMVLIGRPGAWVGDTWLLRGTGSGTRETALGILAQLDPAPATMTLGTHGACVAAAREGLGVSLVHQDAVRRDLASGELVVIDLPGTPLARPWHLCTTSAPVGAVDILVRHAADPRVMGAEALTPLEGAGV